MHPPIFLRRHRVPPLMRSTVTRFFVGAIIIFSVICQKIAFFFRGRAFRARLILSGEKAIIRILHRD